jgi:dihydroorotate dehydrogenase
MCLDAGAVTVQIYTALIFQGPRIVRSLTSGLASALHDVEAPVIR